MADLTDKIEKEQAKLAELRDELERVERKQIESIHDAEQKAQLDALTTERKRLEAVLKEAKKVDDTDAPVEVTAPSPEPAPPTDDAPSDDSVDAAAAKS